MHKKILAVFAHPDDEAFGPGGTLARYAAEGAEIHILCATRGEAGELHTNARKTKEMKVHHVREQELIKSAEVIGVSKVEFLDYIDGTLCNAIYHQLADKIIKKINTFQPQVIVTLDRLGISGHIDHMAVAMITTYAFIHTKIPQKLYYLCLPRKWVDKQMKKYFIYFPQGYKEDEITTRIDYKKYWGVKRRAMIQHKSQWKDVLNLLARFTLWPKVDHFILGQSRGVRLILPETDLFSGIED